jgi:predicted regulator of Ras-like GTPase activity (Roadblock/LC7/MglB family)
LSTKAEKLEQIIQELKQLPTVIDTILISRSGIIIAPRKDKEIHAKTFVAICATMSGAAVAALSELHDVGPNSIVVEGKQGVILIVDAGPKAILIVLKKGYHYIEELLVIAETRSSRIKELLS